MCEKKKLLDSQKELLNLKRMAIERAEIGLQSTLNRIAIELGVNPDELQFWRLDRTGEYLECLKNKKPQMKIPKGKK